MKILSLRSGKKVTANLEVKKPSDLKENYKMTLLNDSLVTLGELKSRCFEVYDKMKEKDENLKFELEMLKGLLFYDGSKEKNIFPNVESDLLREYNLPMSHFKITDLQEVWVEEQKKGKYTTIKLYFKYLGTHDHYTSVIYICNGSEGYKPEKYQKIMNVMMIFPPGT